MRGTFARYHVSTSGWGAPIPFVTPGKVSKLERLPGTSSEIFGEQLLAKKSDSSNTEKLIFKPYCWTSKTMEKGPSQFCQRPKKFWSQSGAVQTIMLNCEPSEGTFTAISLYMVCVKTFTTVNKHIMRTGTRMRSIPVLHIVVDGGDFFLHLGLFKPDISTSLRAENNLKQ